MLSLAKWLPLAACQAGAFATFKCMLITARPSCWLHNARPPRCVVMHCKSVAAVGSGREC
ncbi:hypothetical protein PF001_g7988 [Phytophthora fragariae]|uniref:Uncharacterized protein n=1 Tax=Phytophthora fragariae TaxID=53985 RepID=A0A6A4E8D3_9STRA|nr:hypothetical protein PF001_g7988 [Phytophthora fragariae]